MRRFFSLLLLVCLAWSPCKAQDNPPAVFLPDTEVRSHEATIHRLEEYLSGLTTIISDFMQVAPDGSLANGRFYLKRPGKMRWAYNPPTPVLMVANGSELIFYDYELEQETHIPLDSTLIGFLAQKTIRFGGKVGATEFSESAGVIRIGLAQRDKPTEGGLVLEFSDKPLSIRNMVVTDATGQRTTVSLNHATFGMPLDDTLFVFQTPQKHRKAKP